MRHLSSNIYKNQQYFHKKMFKIKQIKQIKQIKTTSTKKKQNYNPNFLKNAFLSLFSFFNIFLFYNFFYEEDENKFFNEKENEKNQTKIKFLNNYNSYEEDYQDAYEDKYQDAYEEDYQENAWFNTLFFGSFILLLCGFCAYYFYTHGFSFENNMNSSDSEPVKNLPYFRNTILSYLSFELIEQYKNEMVPYFTKDIITLYDIYYNIQQFIDHAEENSGKIAIKALEKILSKLIKNKNRLDTGDTEKGIEILRAVIIELKSALIKGLRD